MIMMGGPIDARRSPTAVNNLAQKKPFSWFEQNLIHRVPPKYPGYMRRVYPGFLQHLGFVAMNPDRHLTAHWDYFHHLMKGDGESAEGHRRFYDEYNAVMDLPAEYYLETLDRVFHKHSLPKGTLVVAGERVRPELIKDTAHPDANIIFGASIDDSLGDEVRITVIAAGFDRFEGTGDEGRPSRRSFGRGSRRDEAESEPGHRYDDDDDVGLGDGDDDFDVPEFLR